MQPGGCGVRRAGWNRRNGTPVTTRSPLPSPAAARPWTSDAPHRPAVRHRVASLLAVLVVLALAAATAWQLLPAGEAPSAAPPSPVEALPAPVDHEDDDRLDQPLDLPPPADHWSDEGVVPPPPAPEPAPAPEPEPEPMPEPEPEPTPEPDPEPDPEPAPAPVDLVVVQQRLEDLGYLLGPADGVKGQQTVAAVMAFQRVNGLAVDGIVGPQTLGALEAPAAPQLRGGPATRVEVDLTRQLAHVVRDGTRVVTLHVSSGNGAPYPSATGGTAYGNTPVGEFRVERTIVGVRESRLGTLYDPLYFYGGYAIHGSGSVPPSPASHGCVRVTMADARWLIANVPVGTPVHLYGGTHVFAP
jgi:hypothetical protein